MTSEPTNRFQIRATEAEATGYPTEGGFVVCEGAIARKAIVPSARTSSLPRERERLLAEGVLQEFDGHYRFMRDYEFDSPSAASAMVQGRTSNGWKDWKHPDGRTMSEVRRVSRPVGVTMLDDAKRQQIMDRAREMIDEGEMFTEAILRQQYATFADRFGPDVLSDLEGEELLNRMHDHSDQDSLVYWLEFKSDEDFDTKRFGSIAGGSAMKFRIFRRSETGHWQAGDKKNKPVDISVEEGIAIARLHRDQLLAGAALLSELPDDATDDDYAELQDQLDELAPDVGRLAWGHKYFSLLFPEKLDDYHSPEWQRFHLMKLLQLPPEGDGRYVCAGRFVSAAAEVGLPLNQFTTVLNDVQGRLHNYWRVGTTAGSPSESHWEMMRSRNCIAVGWHDLGDLSWVEAKRESKEKLKTLLAKQYPSTPQAEGRAASELVHFIATMNEGDIVWAAEGAKILGIGRIDGTYQYEPEFDCCHQRSVEWLSLESWSMPVHEGLQSTVRRIRLHDENIVETERRILKTTPVVQPSEEEPSTVGLTSIRLSGTEARIQSVLDRKSQVIVYGPPGTGKTYWSVETARELAAIANFGKRHNRLSDEQQMQITGDNESSGLVRMCCFHPSYGYEDFLEGYRPTTTGGNVSFELRSGIFKKLCHDAASNADRHYFLIVDEINRGDIPRIFGELLTTLEKDKRGKPITLPVSQESFVVPKNVYLIGTMNTADRSITLLDSALRRRFGFVELMPDGKVLRDTKVSGIPLRAWFESLNARIREHVGRDARNLQIGHSYLMQSGSPIKEIASLRRALRDDIIPLLEEYCYEDYATLARILGTDLVDTVNLTIRQSLLDAGQEEALVQALLAPCPEIVTTTEAISSDESESEAESDDEVDEEDNNSEDELS
ncbi:5-methylcytosine-specific restriction enzyme B [Rubripirellula obstinata]|uniref:5-methylcytosine-specific restriction enzyme B n=1 Tax=Rubripirellula obstinata TaxID=406547 RepID=A0A5B1CEP2_9BACT|nr:DUF4357 domain-containing protein [Rubripirellula obstinata]KAA1258070.1 5-methylcytosine-specific restriction enzyme B [Rubripirellula obstinata]